MKATIEGIAKEVLGIETFKIAKSDNIDFVELAIWEIKEALEMAYKAGKKSVKS